MTIPEDSTRPPEDDELLSSEPEQAELRDLIPELTSIRFASELDSAELNEWISNLTEEELSNYDQLGYLITLLKSYCETPNAIALPEEDDVQDKIPTREIIELLEEIQTHATAFYGKEEKNSGWPIIKCRHFLKALHELKNKWDIKESNLQLSEDFNKTLKRDIPDPFRALVSDKKTSERKNQIINELKRNLHLSNEEIGILIDALQKLKQMHQDTREEKPIEKDSLIDVINELQKIEILRREFPNPTDKYGMKGIERIITSIPNLINLITDATKNESNYGQGKALLNSAITTINMAFQQVAPMLMKRHRSIIRKRLIEYEKLKDVVKGIEDQDINKLVCIILGQISKILSYLDFIRGMQEVTIENKIEYPQRMLRMTPLICIEMEKLIDTLKWIVSKLTETPETFFPKNTQARKPDFPLGQDLAEQSQPNFAITPSILMQKVAEEIIGTFDEIFNAIDATPPKESEIQALATKLELIAEKIKTGLSTATKYIDQTSCNNPPAIIEMDEPFIEIKETPNLTGHIYDFMKEITRVLLQAIVELTNACQNQQHEIKDIIPEFAEYEKQAAKLRASLEQLKEDSETTKRTLDEVLSKKQKKEPIAQIQKAFISIAAKFKEFINNQDENKLENKFYSVMKEEDKDSIIAYMTTIQESFTKKQYDDMDANTLELYRMQKALDQLAINIIPEAQKSNQEYERLNPLLVKCKELKQEEGDSYADKFIEIMEQIKTMTDRHEILTRFLIENPLSQTVGKSHFNSGFSSFQRLIKEFNDFHIAIHSITDHKDEKILSEYDARLIEEGVATIDVLIKDVSNKKTINHCKRAAQKLKYTSPNIATKLFELLKYIKAYIKLMDKNTKPSDFDEIITQLKEIKANLRDQLK